MVGTHVDSRSDLGSPDTDEDQAASPLSLAFLTQEFQKKYLWPSTEDLALHGKSQWSSSRIGQAFYMVHRTAWMIFWGSVLTYVVVEASRRGQLLLASAFLTQWAYATIAVGTIVRFTLAILHLVAKGSRYEGVLCGLDCLFYSAYNSVTLLVSLGYWCAIHHVSQNGLSFANITVHAINSIYVLLDLFISAYPVHLLMLWCPMVYLLLYASANAVYIYCTGESVYERYTDWEDNPEVPVKWFATAIFAFIPCLHFLTFLLYWARMYVYRAFIAPAESPPQGAVPGAGELEPLGGSPTSATTCTTHLEPGIEKCDQSIIV